jgi:phosphoserine phosphatase
MAERRHFFVLTGADGVEDALVQAFRDRLQTYDDCAAQTRRLSDGAVEIGFSGDGLDPGSLVEVLDGARVDVNVVPATDRRKRLLIADMDSTIIGVECIDELADFAGVKAEVAGITEAAMRGELDFEGSLIERVRLLAGLDEGVLNRCFEERVALNPGARVLVRTMRALGAETALVSGGFTFFAERVAALAGFAESRANVLELEGGRLTGKVAQPILGQQAKVEALMEHVARGRYPAASVIAVGDGANDRGMIEAAGLGVAYRAKPALASVADATLDHSDFTAVLALQGIAEDEWVV